MEIAAFKDKSRIMPMLTFSHSYLNILSYKSPFDANLILLDSLLEDLPDYQIQKKKISYKRDMSFIR
jgi:hypothetical protein